MQIWAKCAARLRHADEVGNHGFSAGVVGKDEEGDFLWNI